MSERQITNKLLFQQCENTIQTELGETVKKIGQLIYYNMTIDNLNDRIPISSELFMYWMLRKRYALFHISSNGHNILIKTFTDEGRSIGLKYDNIWYISQQFNINTDDDTLIKSIDDSDVDFLDILNRWVCDGEVIFD